MDVDGTIIKGKLEDTFTTFLDFPTRITDPDELFDKLRAFEETALRHYTVFLKCYQRVEDPTLDETWVEGVGWPTEDLLHSASMNTTHMDKMWDEFKDNLLRHYTPIVANCVEIDVESE